MSMKMVNLSEEGHPDLVLTEDGTVMNPKTGFIYKTNRGICLNILLGHDPITGKRIYHTLSIRKLKAKYFGSELDKIPNEDKKCLDFLGFPDYWIIRDGRIWSNQSLNFLTPSRDNKGYLRIRLEDTNSISHTQKMHRLVALAFIPNPENKEQVNHIDGIKDHNEASNLEWVTNQENKDHAVEHRLHKHRYSDDVIHAVCVMLDAGATDTMISEQSGISREMISYIRHGGYAHVGKMYKFFYDTNPDRLKQIGHSSSDGLVHDHLN